MSELLVALFILTFLMVGIAGMLNSSWQSFSDLKWQNRVDSEARRALDALSDTIRTSGWHQDLYDSSGGSYRPDGLDGQNVRRDVLGGNRFTSNTAISVTNPLGNIYSYYIDYTADSATGNQIPYLARFTPAGKQIAALYIKSVNFDYEYRQPLGTSATTWSFTRTDDPENSPRVAGVADPIAYYTTKTVYITVTAEYNPYPNSIDSRTYTRTITGAVTLRAPFNAPLSPAQVNGP